MKSIKGREEKIHDKRTGFLNEEVNCEKFQGGRGSGIGYVHNETKRIVQFDQPHQGNELYGYQIKKTIDFLKAIGEIDEK